MVKSFSYEFENDKIPNPPPPHLMAKDNTAISERYIESPISPFGVQSNDHIYYRDNNLEQSVNNPVFNPDPFQEYIGYNMIQDSNIGQQSGQVTSYDTPLYPANVSKLER